MLRNISTVTASIVCETCPTGKIGQITSTCAFCTVGMYLQSNYTCSIGVCVWKSVCVPCQVYGTRYQAQLLLGRSTLFADIDPSDSAAVAAFQIPQPKFDQYLCAECECSVFRDALPSATLDTCSNIPVKVRQYLDGTTRQCEICPTHKKIVRDPTIRSCKAFNVTQTQIELREWNDQSQSYECIAGYYSTSTDNTWSSLPSCQPCEAGKYKPLKSADLCTQCPRHTRTSTPAAVSVEECMYCGTDHHIDLTCKRGSVGQSEGLSIPRSSVRFRLNPDTSNSHEFIDPQTRVLNYF